MKKNRIAALISAALISLAALVLAGCPDPSGLHNQQSTNLTIVFTNFPENVNGEYSIPGDFNGDEAWENGIDNVDIVMKNGEGTSNTFQVTASWVKFSLVKVKDTSWLRGWSSTVAGNAQDNGKNVNFWSDINLDQENNVITIDGSTGTAVVSVE